MIKKFRLVDRSDIGRVPPEWASRWGISTQQKKVSISVGKKGTTMGSSFQMLGGRDSKHVGFSTRNLGVMIQFGK